MPEFGDEGDVYVTLPSDGDVHVARDQLHIDTEIVREVATEYNLDANSLHDALARVQTYGECVSLPAIEAVATATIVAADEQGATYVLADAEPCWRAEADRLNLSNAGLDAIVEAHRRKTVATVGQIPEDTVAFVLDCPDIPVRAVQRLRTLRRQTHLENRDALVLALEGEGLKPEDIGCQR